MRRSNRVPVLFLLVAWFGGVGASPLLAESFPTRTGLVTDSVGLLTESQKSDLAQVLRDFKQESDGVEIVVVTIASLKGADQKDYSTRLFNAWGIGQTGKNNGVLVLIVRDDRKISIRTGYGLQNVLTDAQADSIIRSTMTPEFKNGNYFDGIRGGVGEIMNTLRPLSGNSVSEVTSPAPQVVQPGELSPPPRREGDSSQNFWIKLVGVGVLALTVAGIVGGFLFLFVKAARRGRACPQCGATNFNTTSDVVMRAATYVGDGHGVRTKTCGTCRYQDVSTYVIPMLGVATTAAMTHHPHGLTDMSSQWSSSGTTDFGSSSMSSADFGSSSPSSTDFGSSSPPSSDFGSSSSFDGGGSTGGGGADGGW